MNIKEWISLVGFIALSQLAGLLGSIFTFSAIEEWYSTLTLPELAPPNFVFGPVWTLLYLMMGTAAFLVWRDSRYSREGIIALGLFSLQLVLNALWSIIFFGFRDPGLALAEIILLWLAILATIAAFARLSKWAAWLLLPYLLWVSFATYLNFSIWMLNA